MKLETIEDLLEIDTEKLKAAENKRLLTKIKQLIKSGNKAEAKADESSKDYPFEAVSVVGSSFVTVKFDLETKEARVTDTTVDTRDVGPRNYMAGAAALKRLQELVKEQKGVK